MKNFFNGIIIHITNIVKIARGIRFCNPQKNKVLIFDDASSGMLKRMILYGMDSSILFTRFELLHLTPAICLGMVRHFGRVIRCNAVRTYAGKLYLLYLESCIDYISPLVVLTIVDNSPLFQALSRIHGEAYFYAIQNGCRGVTGADVIPRISMTSLFCFGQYEVDLYTTYNNVVDQYYPIGSLIGGYYKSEVEPEPVELDFDICLVSEWEYRIFNEEGFYPDIRKSVIILNKFLKQYIEGTELSLSIATRYQDPREEAYYKDFFGSRAHLVLNDRERFTTYRAMNRSKVTLSFNSTAAVEALGWGNRVLLCNFTADERYNLPVQGIWSMIRPDYEMFKERLDTLLNMDDDTYEMQTRDFRRYVMNYDFSNPPHVVIRNTIMNNLA